MPEDGPLLDLAQAGIADLNRKYSRQGIDTFFLLHRARRWNAGERLWMGYERKRGKLEELNSFLRGWPGDHFSRVVGNTAVLQGVRYVITLDTDTQLPRDSVWQFVGAMAHPLNRPVYDDAKQRVTEGYGILQPRVAVSLPAQIIPVMRGCGVVNRALTRTRAQCRTFTRMFSAKVLSSARESMTWMSSSRLWVGVFLKTAFLATIS